MIGCAIKLWVDRFSDRKGGHLDRPATQILSRNTTRGIRMKTCTKCHQKKELVEFYTDSGTHSSQCGHKPHCKDCVKEQHKIYLQSPKGRAITRQYAKTKISKVRQNRYCLRYPERRKAKDAVYWAIQKGNLPRPDTKQCPCGNHRAEQYHHHKGYGKEHWLDVTPVCRKYHTKLHGKNPELQETTDGEHRYIHQEHSRPYILSVDKAQGC